MRRLLLIPAGVVDDELAVFHIKTQWRHAAHPHALFLGGGDLVADACINNAISRIAGMLAIDAATNAAVRADREARFFTICSSYAPILNQRREISR
jgi:hypothetical protein